MNRQVRSTSTELNLTSQLTATRETPTAPAISFRTLAEGMREGLIVLDRGGRVAHFNTAAERIFGLGNLEAQGLPLWAPELGLDPSTVEEACDLARRTGAPVEFEMFFARDRTWLDIRIKPCPQGLLVYLVQRAFRISADQVVAEHLERFELISQTTTDVIWDWNLLENRFWRSEGAAKFLGTHPPSGLPPVEAWLACIPEEERDRVRQELQALLAGNQDQDALEYPIRRADGKMAYLVERVRVLRDPHGRALRAIGCIRDVSEQKQLETQLRRAQRLESIGRVAGGVAHDLNNILTPVAMALDLLALDANESHERKVMESLRQSIAHGASLLQILLTFGRGAEAEKTVLEPGQVMRDVLQIARETFPGGIRLTSNIPGALPPIRGNSTQLRQVLLNLIINARDAMCGRGHLQVHLRQEVLDATAAEVIGVRTGAHLVFSVIDDGPGIPPEILDKIWDPFFTTKAEGEGTGLGLSTASAIVTAHGGGMHVTSDLGTGTTFQVYLPACEGVVEKPPEPKPPVPAPPRRGGRTVLLADDDAAIRKVAARILEKRGYKVIATPTGSEILDPFRNGERAADLVIIDLKLPLPDGDSVVGSLRKWFPDLPIVATSAYRSEGGLPPSLHRDVDDFVAKPFTGHELLSVIEKHLARVKER